ncbi:MAG: hypothetical protein QMC70_08415 [Bacteroidia bacterium]|jgi:hypothetical protein|tara:strand:+ start:430 stop:588 length:159 start_codon:yes stop_codon:yes gene_type:complete
MGISTSNNSKIKDAKSAIIKRDDRSANKVELIKLQKSDIESRRASYDVFVAI